MTMDAITVSAISQTDKDTRDEAFTYITAKVEQKKCLVNIRVKVDTGAQGNTLPLRMFRRMFPEKLSAEGYPAAGSVTDKATVLSAYNGTNIPHYGTLELPCKLENSD